MAQTFIRLAIDTRDIKAYQRELHAIFIQYGCEENVQPHNRAAYDAAMKRAGETFKRCIDLVSGE